MANEDRLRELNLKEYPARKKVFNEKVVFVPFFGGNQKHLLRHIRLVNELGFDAVAFDLSFHKRFILKHIPLSETKDWGIVHMWADEIHLALESIQGPKQVFSFSNPTASLFKAMTKIKNRKDIKCVICDGGPFQKIVRCVWNLSKHEFKLDSRVLRLLASAGMFLTWGPDHPRLLKESIMSLPIQFPVLSIRAWKDELVPIAAIEKAFEDGKHLDLRVLEIPEAKHLTGLRDSPKIYREKVESFLTEFSSPT